MLMWAYNVRLSEKKFVTLWSILFKLFITNKLHYNYGT